MLPPAHLHPPAAPAEGAPGTEKPLGECRCCGIVVAASLDMGGTAGCRAARAARTLYVLGNMGTG